MILLAEPEITIHPHGRMILNRLAADFFESAGFGNVILIWDSETRVLSIRGVKGHPEQHTVYYGEADGNPAVLDAKVALSSIGYDFREKRTLPARLVPEEGAVEVTLDREWLGG